jgi:hypothetical protein
VLRGGAAQLAAVRQKYLTRVTGAPAMEIHITDSSRGRKMLLLMQELSEMPEHQLYSELMALDTSIYILDANFVELEKFVLSLTSDPKWDHLFLAENRGSLHSVSRDIVRRLHNFVAAAHSLREHALAIYNRRYKDANLMPEYSKRARSVFGNDPLAQFVMGLRRYCQHYRSPHMGFETAWPHDGSPPRRTAMILKEDLVTFEAWPAAAKQFITDIETGVDILQICRSYRMKVLEFYEWFQGHQESIHRDELARFRKKEAELLLLQLEDKLDRSLASPGSPHSSEQALFFHMFIRADFDKLLEVPPSSPSRPEAAIRLIEKRFPLPESVKAKIHSVYELQEFKFYSPPEQDARE